MQVFFSSIHSNDDEPTIHFNDNILSADMQSAMKESSDECSSPEDNRSSAEDEFCIIDDTGIGSLVRNIPNAGII